MRLPIQAIALCLALVLPPAGSQSLSAPNPVPYRSIQGRDLSLYVWKGRNIAILTPRNDLDPMLMARIVAAADGAWEYYERMTGHRPTPNLTYEGLATIAVVPSTCGAGCTYIGQTGTEITGQVFNWMYDGVKDRLYDQVIFYEFGRSFWFYGSQLGYRAPDHDDCVVTGYAVLMRYRSMAALDLQGSMNGARTTFDHLLETTHGLIDVYANDPRANWSNTFRGGAAVRPGHLPCTDLFASMMMRLADQYGGDTFLSTFLHETEKQRPARDTGDAVDNLVLAASIAARTDLAPLFRGTWKWPVSRYATKKCHEIGARSGHG